MLRKRADRSMADLICGAESSTSSISSAGFLFVSSHFEVRDVGALAGEQLRASQAAAGLDELRRVQVALVQDQAGRKLEKRGALIRAADQDA